MPHTLTERVIRWSMDMDADADFLYILDQIHYLADKRFHEYQPTFGAHPGFMIRLRDWLNNLRSEGDQKLLLRLVPNLFFLNSTDFWALYRAIFRDQILRWLIECEGIQFPDPDLRSKLSRSIQETWFCAISDSMEIATFYHVNNLEGVDLRPDWRTLNTLGDPVRIAEYMTTKGLKKIVLLEDFVGSGTQMEKAVKFAAGLPNIPPVLLAPLIIAPAGYSVAIRLCSDFANLNVSPAIKLEKEAFVCEVPANGESSLMPLLRELLNRCYLQVSGGIHPNPKIKPYGPYGFGRDNPRLGALLIMHSNCPDNTIPIVHHSSKSWKPLFPRSSRV